MSTTTIAGIKTLIETKLATVAGIKAVYPYATGTFTGYPAAVIRPTGGRGVVEDTARNERVFSFAIELYQEQTEAATDAADADTKMTTIADLVLQAFDQDPDLGREVSIVRVVAFDLNFKVQAGTHNFATFAVDCVVLVPHY